MGSSVVPALVLVLVLCAALSIGDRRRPEHTNGDQQRVRQHQRQDGDERGPRYQHHHHDDQRYHRRHRDDDDGNDSDDEEEAGDDRHHHHHRFVDLADSDGSHWGHGHDGDERRPGSDGHGQRPAQDDSKDGKKNGQKDGKKNGQKKSDSRRGNDRSESDHHHHHQEDRRREGNNRGEQHQHRGDDHSKKNHSKSSKQTRQRSEERHNPTPDSLTAEPQTLSHPADSHSSSDSGELSPAAESLAAAMAVSGADLTPSAAEEGAHAEPLPPPHQDVAAMARYIVHVSDWAAMATISTRPPTRGMPFANVFSVCDGTRYRSTGIPYLYLTDMEISVQDLRVNNSASLTMSLAQTQFCRQRGYDPEDPLCAHVILSGRVLQVDEQDPEFVFARDALFARHPEMSDWPTDHHFFVAKLDIANIIVLDYFGGAKTVPVAEYFATNPFKVHPRRANMV